MLAIRWPNGDHAPAIELRSAVDLFRHVFAYLSEDAGFLANSAPDHGYLMRDHGTDSLVFQVLEDGHLMTSFVEVDEVDDGD